MRMRRRRRLDDEDDADNDDDEDDDDDGDDGDDDDDDVDDDDDDDGDCPGGCPAFFLIRFFSMLHRNISEFLLPHRNVRRCNPLN